MRVSSALSMRISEEGLILESSGGLDYVLRASNGGLRGRSLRELMTAEQADLLVEEFRKLRAGIPSGGIQLDLLDESGGRSAGFWAFCWDQEERVFLGRVPDTTVALPAQDDVLRLLLDHLEEAVIAVGPDWSYRLVNRAAAQICGLELLSIPLNQWPEQYGIFSGPDGSRVPFDQWPAARALGGEPAGLDDHYYRTPVSEGWLQCRACPLSEGALLIFRDVTAQRESVQGLVAQARLLDEAQDAITVRTLEGRITYWSRGAERIYGFTQAQVMGQEVSELLQGDPEVYDEAMREVLEQGVWLGEMGLTCAAGKSVLVQTRWSLMRDPDGTPRGILGIETDITEKRKLEARFLRAQRLESLGTMAGGIAHDLNNVLAPILMAVDLLGGQNLDDEGKELLSLVHTSARRGAELVKQVLTFARGAEGRPVPTQVGLLVEEVARMARDTFPKNLRVEVDLAPELPAVLADPTQIHQVLLNLCLNSRDSMIRGGTLTLRAVRLDLDEAYAAVHPGARPGSYVVISVSDTGIGMEPAVRDRVFEPFFTTKPHGEGTGLGLSTALAIVKSHGGFITLSTEPDRGTVVHVHLRALTVPGLPPTRASAPRGRGELIMVVDDEAPIRHLTQQSLEAHGYRVLSAADGAEAVALYAQHRQETELVLLDMLMPIMDGYTTIAVLQRIEPTPTIVAATGLPGDEEIDRIANLGVRHILPKPYTPDALLHSVRQALDQSPSRITSPG